MTIKQKSIEMMLKKLIFCALACGMLAGCNKEIPGQAGNDLKKEPGPGQLCQMELHCRLEPLSHVETKAAASADDKVYKLDILEYDADYTFQAVHTYEDALGIDLENFVFQDWKTYGETRYYFLLANLDEDTIEYVKSLSTNNFSSRPVPLSAGNWQNGHIPMGGWTYFYYGSSTTAPDAVLYRYMFRIDIGTVTASRVFPSSTATSFSFSRTALILPIPVSGATPWDIPSATLPISMPSAA